MTQQSTNHPAEDDRERVRSYIVSQAERYVPVDYWPRLMEQRVKLLRLLDEMSPEQAAWQPPSGEAEDAWSAIEIAQHVRQWSDHVVEIARASVDDAPTQALLVGHVDPDPRASLAEVQRALIVATHRLSDALLNDAERASPTRTVQHGWFGPLTTRQWFVMARVHDTDHIRHLEGLLQIPGFPASGR